MSCTFGTNPPAMRALFGDTLTAGGGWTKPPPGWGGARQLIGAAAR
jgi:hypothetical protein